MVRNVGVSAQDGHGGGTPGRVHAAGDLRTLGIGKVDHQKTGLIVRDVGVGARDRHATDIPGQVHAAHVLGTRGTRDVHDLNEAVRGTLLIEARHAGIVVRDGHATGISRCLRAA